MPTQVTMLTHDKRTEIIATYSPGYYRFTIRPCDCKPDISNTRHYAFADEAVSALILRGYDYGAALIGEVVSQLPKLHLREQTI